MIKTLKQKDEKTKKKNPKNRMNEIRTEIATVCHDYEAQQKKVLINSW